MRRRAGKRRLMALLTSRCSSRRADHRQATQRRRNNARSTRRRPTSTNRRIPCRRRHPARSSGRRRSSLKLDPPATVWRILYHSRSRDDRDIAVSGLALVPNAPATATSPGLRLGPRDRRRRGHVRPVACIREHLPPFGGQRLGPAPSSSRPTTKGSAPPDFRHTRSRPPRPTRSSTASAPSPASPTSAR